jgi:glycosidase
MSETDVDRAWWKEAVCYQIYPRSFNDTDGDGVGDIPGILRKVDYIEELGVDVVWLNPVYESPNADNGYDIADYRAIMDEFGTMADWDRLLAELHDRDIRLIMDLVVNHTSDEHAWFVNSRDPDSPYRDWYYWREGRDPEDPEVAEELADGWYTGVPRGVEEAPPNDWQSFFGGPAWTYDERSGEWYLHLFDEKQPDLNWETPEVREAVFEMMEWWLEKGIDGFRMDVINLLSKEPGLPDGETDDAIVRGADKFVNGPKIHEYLSELHDRVLADGEYMTVGEMVDLTVEEAREFLAPDGDGMSMAFTFDHMRLDFGPRGRWDVGEWSLPELKATMSHWQYGLAESGWNAIYLNNHDEPRQVSRFGDDDEYRYESATLLATLTHTLRGTPFIYQGEEIGMTNYPFESLAEVRDVDTLKNVRAARKRGRFANDAEVLDLVRYRSRDNARTPMQWTDGPYAGFTDPETGDGPWIPVNPNKDEINVEAARADPDSVFHYYRELIELRSAHDALIYGEYELLDPADDRLWTYTRTLGDDQWLVTLNVSAARAEFHPPAALDGTPTDLALSNYEATDRDGAPDGPDVLEATTLRPYEARVYRLLE